MRSFTVAVDCSIGTGGRTAEPAAEPVPALGEGSSSRCHVCSRVVTREAGIAYLRRLRLGFPCRCLTVLGSPPSRPSTRPTRSLDLVATLAELSSKRERGELLEAGCAALRAPVSPGRRRGGQADRDRHHLRRAAGPAPARGRAGWARPAWPPPSSSATAMARDHAAARSAACSWSRSRWCRGCGQPRDRRHRAPRPRSCRMPTRPAPTRWPPSGVCLDMVAAVSAAREYMLLERRSIRAGADSRRPRARSDAARADRSPAPSPGSGRCRRSAGSWSGSCTR